MLGTRYGSLDVAGLAALALELRAEFEGASGDELALAGFECTDTVVSDLLRELAAEAYEIEDAS